MDPPLIIPVAVQSSLVEQVLSATEAACVAPSNSGHGLCLAWGLTRTSENSAVAALLFGVDGCLKKPSLIPSKAGRRDVGLSKIVLPSTVSHDLYTREGVPT